MVPSFISMTQARKILATGKSINFLRQVCEDHSPVNSREILRRALQNNSGMIFSLHSMTKIFSFKVFCES